MRRSCGDRRIDINFRKVIEMKKLLALVLTLAMAMILAACGGSKTETSTPDGSAQNGDSGEEFTIDLKFGHGNTTEEPIHTYSQAWADAVKEATNGRINITIYPAGQLGTLAEMQEAVEYGTLDMTLGDTSLLSNLVPAMGVANLPMLLDSYEMAEKYYDGEVSQALNEELATSHNIRPLGWYWNGFRQIGTRVPITCVADCKDIKLRSPEADIYMDTFNLLGMKPTPLPWGETYSAYESGIVDGMETTTIAMATQGFHKVGGNVCRSNHMISVVGPVINEQVWQSIPAEDQQLMLDLLAEQVAAEREVTITDEDGYFEQMAADGANITKFEDPQELVDLFTPYWTEYAEQAGASDVLESILAMK